MKGHLPELDALRGFAVLVVFVSHAANDGMLPAWLGDGFGQMGVQLFFVLSGYLMMRLYGQTAFTAEAARGFVVGRVARIVPLYALVLAVCAVAAAVGAEHPPYAFVDVAEFARAAFFLAAPQELWSIPVEVQFYALFVAIWAAMPLLGGRLVWLLPGTLVLAFVWRGWVSEAKILIPYLSAFILGLVIRHLEGQLRGLTSALARPALAALCLVLFLLNMPGLRGAAGLELTDSFFARMWLDPIRLVALTALFLSALGGGFFWRLPTGLHRLGVISFCVYLVHRPILKAALGIEMPGPVLAVLCLAAAVLLAEASLRLIERPAARATKARFAAPPHPVRQPATG